MSARSQTNATRLPSGDHTGSDGCLMSINCSMVSEALRVGPCPCKWPAHASGAMTADKASRCFPVDIAPPISPGISAKRSLSEMWIACHSKKSAGGTLEFRKREGRGGREDAGRMPAVQNGGHDISCPYLG